MVLKILRAGNGDSMILSFEDKNRIPRNILIDGGNVREEFQYHILPELKGIIEKGEYIDLMIATHSDQDHIKGFQYLFEGIENNQISIKPGYIKEIWFNSSYKNIFTSNDISLREARKLEGYLEKFKEKWKRTIDQYQEIDFYGAKITILSPSLDGLKEYRDKLELVDIGQSCDHETCLSDLIDRLEQEEQNCNNEQYLDIKTENGSSIAFMFEYGGKSLLFLGDAIPKTIEESLDFIKRKRKLSHLEFFCVKLSHHGSIASISNGMLNHLKTDKYIISTNGGKKMPNKITIAKILKHRNLNNTNKISFYFNYPDFSKRLEFKNYQKEDYNFDCFDANYAHGYKLII